MARPSSIPINKIAVEDSPCPRVAINTETVEEYARHLAALPPVILFSENGKYWIGDGHHRVWAVIRASGKDPDALPDEITIHAHVREGCFRDALAHAVNCNATHGLPRTNADKRKSVMLLLQDAEWGQRSDRDISTQCNVNQSTVSRIRADLVSTNAMHKSDVRTGRDGRTYNTKNIGKKKAKSSPVTDPVKASSAVCAEEQAEQEIRERLKAGEKPEALHKELWELADRKLAEATTGGNGDALRGEQTEAASSMQACEHITDLLKQGFASREEDGVTMLWVSNRKGMTSHRELKYCPMCGDPVPRAGLSDTKADNAHGQEAEVSVHG